MKKYLTETRRKLMDLFERNAHRSFSAQDIYQDLSDSGISKSAIYRNLAAMEQAGLLCRVSKNNSSVALYQYVKHEGCKGIIHLKCQACDATVHLDKHVSQLLMGVAQDHYHFQLSEARAYLYGLCENCVQKKNKS